MVAPSGVVAFFALWDGFASGACTSGFPSKNQWFSLQEQPAASHFDLCVLSTIPGRLCQCSCMVAHFEFNVGQGLDRRTF